MAEIIRTARIIGRGAGSRTEVFNLQDMSGRANDCLEDARAKAKQILERAAQEAERIRQQARVEGRQTALQEAQQAARDEASRQYQSLLPSLREAVQTIVEAKHLWQQHWEDHALKFAIAVAERIVRRQLPHMPEVPLLLIRESLELVSRSDQVTLHLNPEDYHLLEDQLEQLTQELGQIAPARIVADSAIGRGGCRVATQYGSIDQQLETQLARIQQELNPKV